MHKALGYLGAAAILATAATPAAADPAKGYRATYFADRNHYCLRPLTQTEATRLGIALYRTECHTAAAWAYMGLKVSRGG
ncbi:MAG: hypothetical protein ABIQ43_00860 [Sphingomonas sp.]